MKKKLDKVDKKECLTKKEIERLKKKTIKKQGETVKK